MTQNFVSYASHGRPNVIPINTTTIDPLLLSLISLCTPHGMEHHITKIIDSQPFIKTNVTAKMYDKEMKNKILIVGDSNTVFSCHMDIVGSIGKINKENDRPEKIHLMETAPAGDEAVVPITKRGFYYGAKRFIIDEVTDKFEGCPVGADDKLGVFILLKMIEANIPGKYIFHTGEECGGLGSKSLARCHPNLFKGIERAIAFDRANYGDIISFQRGNRCCSEEFGEAFAAALNVSMPPQQQFKNEVPGTFTDTASYMELIPECTNVSVGYFNQHGAEEHFDYIWLMNFLLPAILAVDYSKLPTKRDPKKVESQYTSHYKSNYSNYSNWSKPVKKVSWKEANKNTGYLEFPEWNPSVGYPDDASEEVLTIAMGRFITKLSFGSDRDTFCKWIMNLMWDKEELEDEVKTLRLALNKATGIEPLINTASQVDLLERLIVVAENAVLYGDYKKWLDNYIKGAKRLLKKSSPKQKKLNTIIFAISVLLDSSENHTQETIDILKEVEKFIVDNPQEEGFGVNNKLLTAVPKKAEEEIQYNSYDYMYYD